MGMEPENNEPQSTAGRGEAIDLTDPKDQAMVRRFIRQCPTAWRTVDKRLKAKWVGQLEAAGDSAMRIMQNPVETKAGEFGEQHEVMSPSLELAAAKVVASVVKTGMAIEGQNLKVRMKREEYDRLDAGKATNRTEHVDRARMAALIMQDPTLAPLVEKMAELTMPKKVD